MRKLLINKQHKAFFVAILAPSVGAAFLLMVRVVATSTLNYTFMLWNLTLSLMAVAAALLCAYFWGRKRLIWKLVFFFTWLFLLPNTFYMLTDYVHLGETADINLLFDITMLCLFAMAGFIQGCIALYIMHVPLIKRAGRFNAHLLIGLTILASSFAVDMGRFLRWNSWDILLHPQTIIFDLSDTFLNPLNYNRSVLVTAVFFVTISSAYVAFWYGASLIPKTNKVK